MIITNHFIRPVTLTTSFGRVERIWTQEKTRRRTFGPNYETKKKHADTTTENYTSLSYVMYQIWTKKLYNELEYPNNELEYSIQKEYDPHVTATM